MKEIPRYGKSNLESRITICVSNEIKELWDYLIRVKRYRLAEDTRRYWSETLKKLAAEVKEDQDSE